MIKISVDEERHFKHRATWAILVKLRAKEQCESCGSQEDLQTHHLDPKGPNSLENGKCLCRKCHVTAHMAYGSDVLTKCYEWLFEHRRGERHQRQLAWAVRQQWTRAELARRLGYSDRHLYRIQTGEQEITEEFVAMVIFKLEEEYPEVRDLFLEIEEAKEEK